MIVFERLAGIVTLEASNIGIKIITRIRISITIVIINHRQNTMFCPLKFQFNYAVNQSHVLMAQQLLHFLEFHNYFLVWVDKLHSPSIVIHLKDLKALVLTISFLELIALFLE